MKKFLMLAIMAVAGISLAVAQPRAVGGRLGYGIEASYQHALGESNMVEVEFGIPGFGAIEAACTYDWINPGGLTIPWEEKGNWNWYAGVGGAIQTPFNFKSGFIGAAGRLGVEYNFWFPLQLSIDFRPTLGVAFNKEAAAFGWDVYAGGLGLSARYKF